MIDPPMQPELSGDAVALRPMRARDFDALFALASDPEIWAIHPAHDRWQKPVFRAFFDEGLASGGALVVEDRTSGAMIGHSRYDTGYCLPGEVEIGWTFLSRAHWGGATNRAIKRLMISHAFESGFDAVIFRIGENNWRSRRALEKIGGALTDRTQVADMARGAELHVIYRIDRVAFASGPLA